MQQLDSPIADGSTRNRKRFRAYLAGGALLVCAAIAIRLSLQPTKGPQAQLQHARIAYDAGNFPRSLRLSKRVLESDPNNGDAALMAGRSALELNRHEEAVDFFDRVPREQSANYITARIAAGDLLLGKLRRLSEAAKRYRDVVSVDENNLGANDRLAFILGLASRRFEQTPYRLRLIRRKNVESVYLLSLALGESAFENQEMIQNYHRANPEDPFLLISLARLKTERQLYEEGRVLLNEAVRANHDLVAAQIALGTNLFEHATAAEFLNWHTALPQAVERSAELWVLRARWLLKADRRREAVRCFGEALQRDPNHSRANYQLGQLLTGLKKDAAAAAFLGRARRLRKYVNLVKVAYTGSDPQAVRDAAELAESLSLFWEAYAWAQLASRPSGSATPKWARAMISRLEPRASSMPLVRTPPRNNPIPEFALREFPLPTFPKSAGGSKSNQTSSGPSAVTFEDRAAAAGLKFRYFNGRESVESGLKLMYEFGGGGVAVLDYDCDLRPDIHFTQGCRWPADPQQVEHLDSLFRNTGDGRLDDVTVAARLREAGFSQGATVGDFDSDGFPDLFIANIGRNRLLRNLGDGTFAEFPLPDDATPGLWSTSALLADVNDDGHPDLYVVNYLTGRDVFTRTCRSGNRDGICLPQSFPAEQDRLYLSTGDGGFRDVTASSGIQRPDGKGLGIVAADFDGSGRLSLFVANDTTPNFFFAPRKNRANGGPLFSEDGMKSGLAMNRSGQTESCMGVALGDADGDGRLDLFATNFFAESNTLYRQISPRSFDDVTPWSGLRAPSLPMVGFGTQFLDADNDGRLDLIVANGHIDDFRETQSADFKMLPQFFANRGKGRFQIVPGKTLGPYFLKKSLGRSVARLDWNGDGREDVAISHLDAPAALLTNTTKPAGGWLSLRLRGTASTRDAIGASVQITTDRWTATRQLTAGDGYLASNERKLMFGLAQSQQIHRLEVRWPSGKCRVFQAVRANREYLIVEGSGELLELR